MERTRSSITTVSTRLVSSACTRLSGRCSRTWLGTIRRGKNIVNQEERVFLLESSEQLIMKLEELRDRLQVAATVKPAKHQWYGDHVQRVMLEGEPLFKADWT